MLKLAFIFPTTRAALNSEGLGTGVCVGELTQSEVNQRHMLNG